MQAAAEAWNCLCYKAGNRQRYAVQGLMVRKWFLAEVPETMLKDGGKGPPPKSSVTMEIRWVPYIHPHDLN